MNYQEKLDEIICEIGNIDDITLDDFMSESELEKYHSKEVIFIAGVEKGLKIALKLAEDFKVNKDLNK